MDRPDLAAVDALFDELLDLDSASRSQRMDDLSEIDPSMHKELSMLLASDKQAAEVLGALDSQPSLALAVGATWGPYELTRAAGAGSMGRVYQAKRVDGRFDHTVAIKFLTLGASDDIQRRFQSEIQILARLSHPNIVSLIDGGSDQGVHYLVMQWIDGKPLNEASQECDFRQRLDLFDQLLKAVDHAHRHLVIHRDLKPSNVMVDSEGQVKLLDFGISKNLDGGATQTQALMTPRYAAPEQILGQPISVATDIFSLGMLLFEVIAEKLPPMPTSGSLESLVDYARTLELPDLGQIADTPTHPDLCAIVGRCLMREPQRRYATVAELARDLRRYREGRPVQARRLGRSARLGRWLLRHRWAAGATLATGLALAVGTTLHLNRLQVERDQAQAAFRFLTGLFGDLNPMSAGVDALSLPVADVFQLGLKRLESGKQLSPQSRAELALTFSAGLSDAGRYEQAIEAADFAINTLEELMTTEPEIVRLTVSAYLTKLLALGFQGDSEGFMAVAELAERLLPKLSDQAIERPRYWHLLGNHLQRDGHVDDANEALGRAVEQLDAMAGSAAADDLNITALADLAVALRWVSDERAVGLINRSIALAKARNIPDTRMGLLHAKRAGVRGVFESSEAATEDHLRAMELTARSLGPDHRESLVLKSNYALNLMALNRHEEAVTLLQQVLERSQHAEDLDPMELAKTLQNIAAAMKETGQYREATAHAEQAQALYESIFPDTNHQLALPRLTRAEIALLRGDAQLSGILAAEAIARLTLVPQDHVLNQVARVYQHVANTLQRGCQPEASAALTEEGQKVVSFLTDKRRVTPLLREALDLESC
ncbi:MAG: protein kinase [Lysobacterales bacterium]